MTFFWNVKGLCKIRIFNIDWVGGIASFVNVVIVTLGIWSFFYKENWGLMRKDGFLRKDMDLMAIGY